jgi:hypothetical protein
MHFDASASVQDDRDVRTVAGPQEVCGGSLPPVFARDR